jgi:hypothetical protein
VARLFGDPDNYREQLRQSVSKFVIYNIKDSFVKIMSTGYKILDQNALFYTIYEIKINQSSQPVKVLPP